VKQTRFIEEKPHPEEQRIAREQLQQMVHYAEGAACRRAELLAYFGETFPQPNCGACDNCLSPRDTFDGTLAAQKFLSCIFRLAQQSSFSVGLNHIIDILTGAQNEKIQRWGHERLSTYGIGKEHNRTEWAHIGRELVRLGYCQQTAGQFPTLELTPLAVAMLKQRTAVTLTRPPSGVTRDSRKKRGDIPCDDELFEKLRALRKQLADLHDVPAYVVFSDVTLRHLARMYPTSTAEFGRVPGVGERKLAEFAGPFIAAVKEHLAGHERQRFPALTR
jgi:ATP-dependent DNA helicase RecQ